MVIRKQSLVNQSTNPFLAVTHKLYQLPNNINDITREQIASLTDDLIGWSADEMMTLAKTTSRTLFSDLESEERVQRINVLVISTFLSRFFVKFLICPTFKQLSKLKLALDSETTAHANLIASLQSENSSPTTDIKTTQSLTTTPESTPKKIKDNLHDAARVAFLVGRSENRVQALSVIMLYLCTGLQYAQGVANN